MTDYQDPRNGRGQNAALDPDANITAEERQEIFLEIDRVVRENKIQRGEDVWRIKAQHAGASLPLLLNAFILAVVISGLWSVFTFFQASTVELRTEATQLENIEARLLQEMKRESEVALGEKDREIAEIQLRLANIDQEKATIVTEAEAKIRTKERELEQRFQEELARERLRLAAQGFSEEELNRRVEQYAQRRRQEIESELNAFRAQIEVERRQLERALDEAQSQFQASLTAASTERQRLREEARQKEAEFQARQATTSAQLQQTMAELARLQASAAQTAALDTQVSGLIRQARDHFVAGGWIELKRSAESIAQVASLPAFELSEEALGRRAGHQLLSQTLNVLADIRITEVAAAQRQQEEGGGVARALELQIAWSEAEVLLRSAEVDWNRANYEEALEKSARALTRLGFGTGTNQAFFRRWLELGGIQALEKRVATDSTAAQVAWVQAQAEADANPDTARSLLTGLLTQYPLASQRASAIALLKRLGGTGAPANNTTALTERVKELEAEVARLQEGSALGQPARGTEALQRENTDLKTQVTRLQSQVQALQASDQASVVRGLQTENTTLKTQLATMRTELTGIQTRLAQNEAQNQALLRERTQLTTLAGQFTAMRQSYDQYSESLRVLSAESELERKQLLNSFLADLSTPERFRALQTRVQAAIDKAKTAGQTEGMYYAADIMEGTRQLTDERSRRAYFAQLRTRFGTEPAMLEFLDVLERFSQPATQ